MTSDDKASSGGGLGDLLGLLGGANPLAGVTKSVTQFQRGVNDMLESIERFNETLDQLNRVAQRINTVLDAVEVPIRQVAATPQRIEEFLVVIGDLTKRLQPLNQLAETAGGLLGFRRPAPPPPAPRRPAPRTPAAKKPTAKKSGSSGATTPRRRPTAG